MDNVTVPLSAVQGLGDRCRARRSRPDGMPRLPDGRHPGGLCRGMSVSILLAFAVGAGSGVGVGGRWSRGGSEAVQGVVEAVVHSGVDAGQAEEGAGGVDRVGDAS